MTQNTDVKYPTSAVRFAKVIIRRVRHSQPTPSNPPAAVQRRFRFELKASTSSRRSGPRIRSGGRGARSVPDLAFGLSLSRLYPGGCADSDSLLDPDIAHTTIKRNSRYPRKGAVVGGVVARTGALSRNGPATRRILRRPRPLNLQSSAPTQLWGLFTTSRFNVLSEARIYEVNLNDVISFIKIGQVESERRTTIRSALTKSCRVIGDHSLSTTRLKLDAGDGRPAKTIFIGFEITTEIVDFLLLTLMVTAARGFARPVLRSASDVAIA
ncbi:hypothetical protein EVAR_7221_1 [Eumeta japonica]|uniref:Uncharacterized protein n=1 Tax=Eumeta variegata TaxID=151549 RepID=A0A4C1T2H0_EUMVA|nr:hypothetical protein EVAR_7221_1 [Eumeta japonica]